MPTQQSQTLADVCNTTRDLVNYYLHKLNLVDPFHVFTVNDKKLNPVAWQIGHLAWAQDYLLLQGMAGKGVDCPWFELFKIGSTAPAISDYPKIEELKEVFNKVHEISLNKMVNLSDADLAAENHLKLKFNRGNDIKMIIQHHIRHEGTHAGQLSVLAKMFNIKTI